MKSKWRRDLRDWLYYAEWWHFWNPGSGLAGGAIAGALGSVILWVVMR